MGFLKAYAAFWKNYVYFGGRSSRSAFWWVQLWNFLISIILLAFVAVPLINAIITNNFDSLGFLIIPFILFILYALAITIPSISLAIRRFHDVNLSAWWYIGLCAIPQILRLIFQITSGSIVIDRIVTGINLLASIASFIITLLPSKDPNDFKEQTDS